MKHKINGREAKIIKKMGGDSKTDNSWGAGGLIGNRVLGSLFLTIFTQPVCLAFWYSSLSLYLIPYFFTLFFVCLFVCLFDIISLFFFLLQYQSFSLSFSSSLSSNDLGIFAFITMVLLLNFITKYLLIFKLKE